MPENTHLQERRDAIDEVVPPAVRTDEEGPAGDELVVRLGEWSAVLRRRYGEPLDL